ncbi:demethylmenaquinone methyltransferase / 2-methoxy-6-polyprenyl-1,4-benzoquinol methylase [Anaerovirgula multivorans]|uniref:Demethylmenaquinone methyltransferase / 2-methoxy-6-polyprenyl-1,4-benzoquinol methylase n=1 Tax=Anaerovirgula multivorans TaxID=312168 RepID=A0A239LJ50_9FIRM|nr:class I SAM-dependent methyltransferase [Anaerovirgula multivorans]SNT30616.1 demethylmenaquinone methyltransferase / 2-methoxy-6-polyprenyl-1,4-benzoquinol methylase [Anaerovirgula multivorans]
MGIKKFLLDGESKIGNLIYKKMLGWLNNSNRLKYNNPDRLVHDSGILSGQTVLEIGCGSGFFTVPASKVLGNEGKLYCIDIHPLAVEETQMRVNQLELKNVIVKKDDAMKSSFEDSMFDLVLLYGVVPAPVISMKDISKEIYRVLKPGGVCAVWTMAPFWSPRAALKYASFENMKKLNGVFRLRKI